MVGGDYIQKNLDNLAVDGRLVIIAFLKGPKAEVNFGRILVKRQTITASTMRPQSNEAKARMARALVEKVWPLVEAGTVRPVLYKSFPFAGAAESHLLIGSSRHTGHISL